MKKTEFEDYLIKLGFNKSFLGYYELGHYYVVVKDDECIILNLLPIIRNDISNITEENFKEDLKLAGYIKP
jgi:hypothetical protein